MTPEQKYKARFAVDGILRQSIDSGNRCSHTKKELNPWLKIDLQNIALINYIVIYNRIRFTGRLRDIIIYVANSPNMLKDQQVCTTFEKVKRRSKIESFNCHSDTKGRYVKVVNRNHGFKGFLSLCEIRVYGWFL